MITATATSLTPDREREYEDLSLRLRHGVNLHPIWLQTFVQVFEFDGRDLMIEARDAVSGELCGLLPLVRKSSRESRFVTERQLVGVGHRPTDFFDLPALRGRESEVAVACADWLERHQQQWDRLTLNYVPATTTTLRLLSDDLVRRGFAATITSDRAFLKIDTSGVYDEYERALGGQKLKEIRYYQRRLETLGPVRVEHVVRGASQYFDEVAGCYAIRRTAKDQQNPFTRAYMPQLEFMREIVRRYETRGWIRLSMLKANDVTVAYAYTFTHNRIVYYSMPTFPEEYRDYSPGKLLLLELIRAAFGDPNVDEFNFMRGEMAYKQWFAPVREPYLSLQVINPFSYRSKILAAVQSARRMAAGLRRVPIDAGSSAHEDRA